MFIRIIYFILFIAVVSCNNTSQQEQTTLQNDGVGPVSNDASPAIGDHGQQELMKAAQQPKENPYKDSKVEVKTFRDSLGWGYDIFIDGNQYVHQPHIPAVSGNKGFGTAENAKKTGDFVAYKIKNNMMPPSVTPGELDSLGVLK